MKEVPNLTKENIGFKNECFYHYGEIVNSGKEAILCGSSVRLYSFEHASYLQTISRSRNAIIALSNKQDRISLINASNNAITITEYSKENGSVDEQNCIMIKDVNTDGGHPQFSSDDRYLFFGTNSKRLWRYTCGTNLCQCIYQVDYPDQALNFDMYADRLLISLTSSSNDSHCGYDILDVEGNRIISLRYGDEKERLVGKLTKARWLDTKNIIVLYSAPLISLMNPVQIVSMYTENELHIDPNALELEKLQKTLANFYISPNRYYGAFSWMNWGERGPDMTHTIRIISMNNMRVVDEVKVKYYADMSFSRNSRYLFICAEPCVKIDLGQ